MMRTRLKDIQDKVKFLRSHPLLKDLSTEILAKMSDLLQVVSIGSVKSVIKLITSNYSKLYRVVPYLMQLDAGFSPCKLGFIPKVVYQTYG
jgi:hypothetical protein